MPLESRSPEPPPFSPSFLPVISADGPIFPDFLIVRCENPTLPPLEPPPTPIAILGHFWSAIAIAAPLNVENGRGEREGEEEEKRALRPSSEAGADTWPPSSLRPSAVCLSVCLSDRLTGCLQK